MFETVVLIVTLAVSSAGEAEALTYEFESIDECMVMQAAVLAEVPGVTEAECVAVFDSWAPAEGEVRS